MKMIVIVAGTSRGAGNGISTALRASGAIVYVTGRSVAGGVREKPPEVVMGGPPELHPSLMA